MIGSCQIRYFTQQKFFQASMKLSIIEKLVFPTSRDNVKVIDAVQRSTEKYIHRTSFKSLCSFENLCLEFKHSFPSNCQNVYFQKGQSDINSFRISGSPNTKPNLFTALAAAASGWQKQTDRQLIAALLQILLTRKCS